MNDAPLSALPDPPQTMPPPVDGSLASPAPRTIGAPKPVPPEVAARFPKSQALPTWAQAIAPDDFETQVFVHRWLVRVIIAGVLVLGGYYLVWRYMYTINWEYWWISLGLLISETYSYIGAILFGLGMWSIRARGEPPPPDPAYTCDVYITCYNEPVELVRETAEAARDIDWHQQVYILDDGNSPAMRAMAQEIGVHYITRSSAWVGKDRHAKAGNLVNAMANTTGEFLLILDADQIPHPSILRRTLGYFRDPQVAFVQTPQWFYNTPPGDPFGTDADLFYGPIQQGKDGLNSAFFCGSNAVLRREALMSVGIRWYVRDQERQIRDSIRLADRLLRQAQADLAHSDQARARQALEDLRDAVAEARTRLRRKDPIQDITWDFQRKAEHVSRVLVEEDLAAIQAELSEIPGLEGLELEHGALMALAQEDTLDVLTRRNMSPLTAVAAVRTLLLGVDLDRDHEAEPVLPIATISVTEDMATAMRMHATGWKSVYHQEILARGLAPEDLRSSLQQRLRWAQGTIQVMLRENPLVQPGLSITQRLMYFATMWSYLSGFFSIIYLLLPPLYIFFGWLPVRAFSTDFFWHLLPYLILNQILFMLIGWGLKTWRGQQYSLALFPLWIQAVTSAVGNVYFGRKLGFVVTPKERQGGIYFRLVRPQLVIMGITALAVVVGLGQLALGMIDEPIPILVNVFWACYNLVMLSVVIEAATYQPPDEESPASQIDLGGAQGRIAGAAVRF